MNTAIALFCLFVYCAYGSCDLTYVSLSTGFSVKATTPSSCSGAVVIPSQHESKDVIRIKTDGFKGSSITSITIPSNVTTIEDSAFSGCAQLGEIIFDGTNGIITIGSSAFYKCTSLLSFTFSSKVEFLGTRIFESCSSLTTINFEGTPSFLVSLPDGLFRDCISLTSFTIPDCISTVGAYVFSNCKKLSSVTFPTELSRIVYGAFSGCTSLSTITIPYQITTLESNIFEGCTSLNSVILPSALTSIEENAFQGCIQLVSISLPTNLQSIGIGAFYGCTSLNSINIPLNVTSISTDAFYKCSQLTSIFLENPNIAFGTTPFRECYSIYTIYYNSNTEPTYCSILPMSQISNVIVSPSYTQSSFCGFVLQQIVEQTITLCDSDTYYLHGTCFEVRESSDVSTNQLGVCYKFETLKKVIHENGYYYFQDCSNSTSRIQMYQQTIQGGDVLFYTVHTSPEVTISPPLLVYRSENCIKKIKHVLNQYGIAKHIYSDEGCNYGDSVVSVISNGEILDGGYATINPIGFSFSDNYYFGNLRMFTTVIIPSSKPTFDNNTKHFYEKMINGQINKYKYDGFSSFVKESTLYNFLIGDISSLKIIATANPCDAKEGCKEDLTKEQFVITSSCVDLKSFRTIGKEVELNYYLNGYCTIGTNTETVETQSTNQILEIDSTFYFVKLNQTETTITSYIFVNYGNSYIQFKPNTCIPTGEIQTIKYSIGNIGDTTLKLFKTTFATNDCSGLFTSEFIGDYNEMKPVMTTEIVISTEMNQIECASTPSSNSYLIKYFNKDECVFGNKKYQIENEELKEYSFSDCPTELEKVLIKSYRGMECLIINGYQFEFLNYSIPINCQTRYHPNCISCDINSCLKCDGKITIPTGCVECTTDFEYCSTCDEHIKCLTCDTTTKIINNGICVDCNQVINYCLNCPEGACDFCQDGYYVSNGSCGSCKDKYGTTCNTCDSLACVGCISNEYTLNEGVCVTCVEKGFESCVTCNELECLSCVEGKYLNTSNQCDLCSNKYNSCSKCTTEICTECISDESVYLNEQCISCQIQYPGCSRCNSTQCYECLNGNYLDNGKCYSCGLKYDYCSLCNISSCLGCVMNRTMIDGSCGECGTRFENCTECDTNSCLGCLEGFYLKEGICRVCSEISLNCGKCSTTECLGCKSNEYVLEGGQCKTCIAYGFNNCRNCDLTQCLICNEGYSVNVSGQCEHCSSLFSNCSTCNSTHCFSCSSNTEVALGGECVSCSNKYSKCSTCDQQSCFSCVEGIYFNLGECGNCSEVFDYCSACDSKSCILCNIESKTIINGSCQDCSLRYPGCKYCTNEKCLTCQDGYYEVNGSCLTCEDKFDNCGVCTTTQCKQCTTNLYFLDDAFNCRECLSQSNFTDCLRCTSNTCLRCANKNDIFKNGVCKTCENEYGAGCISCNMTHCLGCNEQYFYNGMTSKCETCQEKYGDTCAYCNSTQCLQCVSSYYVIKGKTCSECSTVFDHCSFCNKEGCIECNDTTRGIKEGKCEMCYSVYNNCSTCNNGGCLECNTNEMFQAKGLCYLCDSKFVGCLKCDEGNCIECKDGYRDSNGICTECNAECKTCNSTHCSSCKENYYLENGECKTCASIGCKTCTNDKSCSSCFEPQILNDTRCYDCVELKSGCIGCSIEGGNITCSKCQTGLILENNECVTCDWCGTRGCDPTTKYCINCNSTDYLLVEGKCLDKNENHCESVNYNNKCEVCQERYLFQDGKCLEVTIDENTCLGEDMITVSRGCISKEQGNCLKVVEHKCNTCKIGYFLVDGYCQECTNVIENCLACNSFTSGNITTMLCSICEVGYFPEINCKPCSAMVGCEQCHNSIESNSTFGRVCTKCADGYVLKDNKCNKIEYCVKASGETCLVCQKKYIAKDGECLPCGEVIKYCSSSINNECTECIQDYYLDNEKKCKLCDKKNCVYCNSIGLCESCHTNYTLTGEGECEDCSLTDGCYYCSNNEVNTCYECGSLHYWENNYCYSCNSMPYCVKCSGASNCLECESGHFPKNGYCYDCSFIDTKCIKCAAGQERCLECDYGYYVEINQCRECKTIFPNCNECSANECFSCQEGFFVKNKRCVPCSTIFGCQSCIDNVTCTRCDSDLSLYKNSEGNMVCSSNCEITGCNKCDLKGKCLECSIPYALDIVNNKCISCFETHSNCAECNSTSNECILCESNEYYLEGKECYLCSNKFGENCYECNSSDCTRCITGELPIDGDCSIQLISQLKREDPKCLITQYFNGFECVELEGGEFKYNDKHKGKCSDKFPHCSLCSYSTSVVNYKELKCDFCQNYHAFDKKAKSNNKKRCISFEGVIDKEGVGVECKEGCKTCISEDTCEHSDTNGFTTRNGTINNYTNDKYCMYYERGYGCVECSNSIGTTGICADFEKNETCSAVYVNEKREFECLKYYILEKTSNGLKGDLLSNCEVVGDGRCTKCITGYYLDKSIIPKCAPCSIECHECQNEANICISCSEGYLQQDSSCIKDINCLKDSNGGCFECKEGYKVVDQKCVSCKTNCIKCINQLNGIEKCNLCAEGYVFDAFNKCVKPLSIHCTSVDNLTSLCKECEKEYELNNKKQCLLTEKVQCSYSNKDECIKCTEGNVLLLSETGIYSCYNQICIDHCVSSEEIGCTKCETGYYLDKGECFECNWKCETCLNATESCLTCKFGFYFNDNKTECLYVGGLAERCKKFLPDGRHCSTCLDGYYLQNYDCFDCDESCDTCVSNSTNCLSCNKQTHYRDVDTQNCQKQIELANCTKYGENGCLECVNGSFLNSTVYKCQICSEGCGICSNPFLCQKCKDQYVLNQQYQCISWKSITDCNEYDSETRKCSGCQGLKSPTIDGLECKHNSGYYFVVIGIPIILLFVIIVIIILIAIATLIMIRKQRMEKLRAKLINECLIKDLIAENTKLYTFGNPNSPLISDKTEINFEGENSTFIPVGKETTNHILIGNNHVHLVKLQFSINENNDKLKVKISPELVTIKKGRAVQFEITVLPLCSCTSDFKVICTVVDLRKGAPIEIELPIKLETELSTRLDYDEIKEEKKLGEGSFGIVFLGTFRGNKVAIKKMKGGAKDERQMLEFEKEVAMLDKFRCDYIINFYGAVFIPNKICMVTEFAQFGSVQDLMKKQPKREEILDSMRIKILIDSIKGIKYLHSNGMIHRDIKPDNILVVSLSFDEKVNGKITDFGSARNINALLLNSTFTKNIGSPAYMAPEVILSQPYGMKSDIYSFGITMFEIFEWHDAYKGICEYPWDVADFVSSGKQLQRGSNTPQNVYDIIVSCWDRDTTNRVSSETVLKMLESI